MAANPVPCQKGLALAPVVVALKNHPDVRRLVPQRLHRYLDEPLIATAWYPEADHYDLLKALVDMTPAELAGGNVWTFFGKIAAQRDIGGQQDLVPESGRMPHAGVYRRYGEKAEGVAGIFLRGQRIWPLYHDTGRFTAHRTDRDPHTVLVRVEDFLFRSRGAVDLQTGYVVEYARLLGYEITGRVRRVSADGRTPTEWEYLCPRTAETAASIATLPLDTAA